MRLRNLSWIFISILLIALITLSIVIFQIILKKPEIPEFSLITGDSYHIKSAMIIKSENKAAHQNRPLYFQFDNYLFSNVARTVEKDGKLYWQIDFNYLDLPESIHHEGKHEVRFGFDRKNMSKAITISLHSPPEEVPDIQEKPESPKAPAAVSRQDDSNELVQKDEAPLIPEDQPEDARELQEISDLFALNRANETAPKPHYEIIPPPNQEHESNKTEHQFTGKLDSPGETDAAKVELTDEQVQDNIEEVKDLKEVLETDVIFDRAWKKDPNTYEDKFKVTDRPDTTNAVEDLSPELRMQEERDKYILAAKTDIPSYHEQQIRNQNYLSVSEVNSLIKKKGYFDLERNYNGSGFTNDFTVRMRNGQKVIIDRKTGLIWQQSGSQAPMTFEESLDWIDNLNKTRYAGYSNWRLPSLEEALTLMEPEANQYGLNIYDEFDRQQMWFWTSSKENAKAAWVVNFDMSSCYYSTFDSKTYVRAVR